MKAATFPAVLVVALLALSAGSAWGHHAAAAFWYTDRDIEVTGTVKEVRIINPHAELVIEVTDDNGVKADWLVFGGPATGMIRNGWTHESLPIGELITVMGNPSRRPDAKAVLADTITTQDGQTRNF